MTPAAMQLRLIVLALALGFAASCVPEAAGVAAPVPQPAAGADPGANAAANPGDPPANLCSYAAAGNGPYCARSLLMGSADDVLYVCEDGKAISQTTCSGRCAQGPDGMPGGDDACDDGAAGVEQQPTPPPATTAPDDPPADGDPCGAASFGDGGYCAQSLDPAAMGGELYTCVAGQTASVVVCPAGCQVMPPGASDACVGATGATPSVDADPCGAAALGDGGYCARSLDPTSSSSKLYTCVGRQTASVTVCPDGCQIMPDGLNDVCASAPPATSSPPIVPTASCSASAAGDCGGDDRWCTNDGQCSSCSAGMFNCNGVYGCECKYGCYGGGCLQCSPDAASSCGGSSNWCYQGQCRLCTQGFFNCDGKDGCECSTGCNGSKCK